MRLLRQSVVPVDGWIYSTALNFKKLWMDYDKTWWMSWVGDKNKLIRFWFRSESRSSLSVGYKTWPVQPVLHKLFRQNINLAPWLCFFAFSIPSSPCTYSSDVQTCICKYSYQLQWDTFYCLILITLLDITCSKCELLVLELFVILNQLFSSSSSSCYYYYHPSDGR